MKIKYNLIKILIFITTGLFTGQLSLASNYCGSDTTRLDDHIASDGFFCGHGNTADFAPTCITHDKCYQEFHENSKDMTQTV